MLRTLTACWLLTCASITAAANITDFGATPDDGKDDTVAFTTALRAAAKTKDATLVLAPGRYDLATRATPPDGSAPPVLPVSGATNLTLDGHGAELVVHDYATLFHFTNCRRVTIRNLKVDYDPLPFTAGKLIAQGDGYVDLEVAPGHPANAGFRAESLLPWDPQRQCIAAGMHGDLFQPDSPKRTELLRPNVLRVPVIRKMYGPGDYVILRHQIYSKNALDFRDCDGVTVDNVTVYTCPGMALHAWGGSDFTLDHFAVTPKGDRWFSATADATHFAGVRGRVSLSSCTLDAMGDDGANVHNFYLRVTDVIDPKTVRVVLAKDSTWEVPVPRPGDTLEIGRDPEPLNPFTTAKVESVTPAGKTATIRLTDARDLKIGDILGDASALPALTVRNCTIRRNRARGILVQTRHVLIEHNTFEDISGAAIQVTADAARWNEGMPAADVTITGNTIRRVNFSIAARKAAIDIFAESGKPPQPAPTPVHHDITITRNTIFDIPTAAVHIGSASHVTVTGNTFTGTARPAVTTEHAADVTIGPNTVADN